MWAHHYRKGPGGTAEYFGSADRWKGPGNTEFRKNIATAQRNKSRIRLIVSRTDNPSLVEAGGDASTTKNEFVVRDDLIGEVAEFDETNYVLRFAILKPEGTFKK